MAAVTIQVNISGLPVWVDAGPTISSPVTILSADSLFTMAWIISILLTVSHATPVPVDALILYDPEF